MKRPSPSHLRVLVVAATASALVVLSACGGDEKPAPTPQPAGDITEYAALGDSYTAVADDGPFSDLTCLRSEANYPSLLAEELAITELRDASCAAAQSDNLTESQYPAGRGQNPPQLNVVTPGTQLVTLGMGLNDDDLTSLINFPCFLYGGKQSEACEPYLEAPDSLVDGLIARMGRGVVEDLKKIREAAPDARVVLIGYPRILSDEKACPAQFPLAKKAVARVRAAGYTINKTLKAAAAKGGAEYLDTFVASEGHDVCSADPWVNGQTERAGIAKAFHPYPAYHEAVADLLAELLEKK